MNQPEHVSLLLEELSADDRELLGRYVAAHAVKRDLDYKLTVREALEAAADEKVAADLARAKAEAERISFAESQETARKTELQERLSAVLDQHTVAQLRGPAGAPVLNELQRLLMMSFDPNTGTDGNLAGPPPMAEFTLLMRYLRTDLADAQATLRQVLDQVRSDPAGIEAQIRAAEDHREQAQRLANVLDGRYVSGFLRNPMVRQEANQVLPEADIELLDHYLSQGAQMPATSPVLVLTLRQALDNARQCQVARP
jgi:hypothetical protein